MLMRYLAEGKYDEVSSESVTSFEGASPSSMNAVDENWRTSGARLPLLLDRSLSQSNTLAKKNSECGT
jgi:hypothetical protein